MAAFIIAVVYCSAHDAANASPWPRKRHGVFISGGTDFFRAEGDFIFDAPPDENSLTDRFQRLSSTNYVEYGVSNKWLAHFKLTYSNATIQSPVTTLTTDGISELEGGLQYTVLQRRLDVVSIKFTAGRENSLGSGVRPGLEADGLDTELRALYGRTLLQKPLKIFATGEVGYRRRFGSPADQIRADAQIGIEPHKRLLILINTFNTISVGNNDDGGADFTVFKVQPSVVFRLSPRWQFQSGATFEVAGQNLVLGNSLFLNLWSEF